MSEAKLSGANQLESGNTAWETSITGNRMTFWDILGWLGNDMTYEEILTDGSIDFCH